MKTVYAFGVFVFFVSLLLGVVVGMSALVGFVVELLWNFVVAGLHHNELHIGFFTAWAGTFLLSILARPFTITIRKNEE